MNLGGKVFNPPILNHKNPDESSIFIPSAMIREARRQKYLPVVDVPPICVLDPDGDIVRKLRAMGQSHRFEAWACYHSDMSTFSLGGRTVGIVGCAVGAPYAVLVAEQMFACGCRLLISITSAGQIRPAGPTPYFVIINRALRDEGTSYHYAAPSEFADADPVLIKFASEALEGTGIRVYVGPSWTTDAPFRETAGAIEAARARDILVVEMEAAALYTYARAQGVPVLCLAHVTNIMGLVEGDFEKGEADGAAEALRVLQAIIGRLGEPDPEVVWTG